MTRRVYLTMSVRPSTQTSLSVSKLVSQFLKALRYSVVYPAGSDLYSTCKRKKSLAEGIIQFLYPCSGY